VWLSRTPDSQAADEVADRLLPTQCVHCDGQALLIAELAPAEALAAVLTGGAMCGRHWSNCAQGLANSHGLTLLRRDEASGR
jgi:hypothetical protein